MTTTDRLSLVLFADLLGFSHRVESAKSAAQREKLARLLPLFASQFSGSDTDDEEMRHFFSKKFWAFSDSIVIRWNEGSEAQQMTSKYDADLEQLSSIGAAQVFLMRSHNQLVRGGVARGWHAERGEVVLSLALVKAAKIEKKIKAPFIGIDPDLYAMYLKEPGRSHYAKHADPAARVFIPPCAYTKDQPALDYLAIAYGEIDLTNDQMQRSRAIKDPEARSDFRSRCWNKNRVHFVKWHRSFVMRGLKSKDPGVKEKYEALRQHHDWRVSMLYPNQPELLMMSAATGPKRKPAKRK